MTLGGFRMTSYYRRRLALIERDGRLIAGCTSCRAETVSRLYRAGLIEPDPPSLHVVDSMVERWVLTDAGRDVLAEADPSKGVAQ